MKIFIIGNIAAGKSTLAKLLSKKTGLTVYSIDVLRRKNNPLATDDGEYLAWLELKNKVMITDNCIVESTGCSKNYETLFALCPDKIIIKVKADLKDCLRNYRRRTKSAKLLPWDFDIEQSLERNRTILEQKTHDIEYNRYNDGPFWKLMDQLF